MIWGLACFRNRLRLVSCLYLVNLFLGVKTYRKRQIQLNQFHQCDPVKPHRPGSPQQLSWGTEAQTSLGESTPLYTQVGQIPPPTPAPGWERGQTPAAATVAGFKDPGKLQVRGLLLEPACLLAAEGTSVLVDISVHALARSKRAAVGISD